MAPEGAAPETTTATDGRSDPGVVQDSGKSDVASVTAEAQPYYDVPPLFEGESVTEAELRGEIKEEATDADKQKKAEEEKTDTAAVEAEAAKKAEEEKAAADLKAKEEKEKEGSKVPLAALHEERGKRQALAAEKQALAEENAKLKRELEQKVQAPAVDGLPKDFKVLSDEEYDALLEEDVVQAGRYMHNLEKYKDAQRAKAESERQQEQAKAVVTSTIAKRYEEMESIVPGLYEEDSEINRQLCDFALAHGMDTDYLSVLLDPATRIVGPKGREIILGKGAVGLLKFINAMHAKEGKAALSTEEIEKLKAEGATSVLTKLTNTDASTQHRNIGDLHAGKQTDTPLIVSPPASEAEMARLSPEQYERLLRGETA